MLTFGGFLLLGGRLGDLYGARRLFLLGLVLFTLASLACGVARSQAALVIARAVQGLGGAVVTAVALSLIMNLFPEGAERAKAMGVYGFVCAAGGSLGEVLGGLVTNVLGWSWICRQPADRHRGVRVLRPAPAARPAGARGAAAQRRGRGERDARAHAGGLCRGRRQRGRLALGADARAARHRPGPDRALSPDRESQGKQPPLVPLRLFRLHNVVDRERARGCCGQRACSAGSSSSALYLQHVLGYDPFRVGLAFLPADPHHGHLSRQASPARMVDPLRDSADPPRIGLLLGGDRPGCCSRGHRSVAASSRTCCRACCCSASARAWRSTRCCFAAMNDVSTDESGLASGIVNTSLHDGRRAGARGDREPGRRAYERRSREGGVEAYRGSNGGYRLAFLAAVP